MSVYETLTTKPYDEKIESDELFQYNQAVKKLAIETRIDLSYFEAESRCSDACSISYSDDSIASPAFAWIRQVIFDHLLLSVSRLYKDNESKKNTYNIARLIKKALCREKELQKFVDGYKQQSIQRCTDANKNLSYHVRDQLVQYQNFITSDYAAIIDRVINHRDKRLAHNEKNKSLSFFNQTNGLSIRDLQMLANHALEISNYIYFCFTNCSMPHNYDGTLKIGGLDCFDGLFTVTEKGVKALNKEQ